MATLNSTTINELKTITYNDLTNRSFFLTSEKTSDDLYSYKFTYDTLSTTLAVCLEKVPENTDDAVFNPKGIWKISDTGKLYTEINSANIDINVKKKLAVNLGHVYTNYIKKLEELSAMYFAGEGLDTFPEKNTLIHDELFIPSYVGQIIVSSKLSSESMLHSIYGKETVWEKISGRLLVGVGSTSKNLNNRLGICDDLTFNRAKILGGSPYVSIGDFVPMHSHCMENGHWETTLMEKTGHGISGNDNEVMSKAPLKFKDFPAACYKLYVFQCPEQKGMKESENTSTEDDGDTLKKDYEGNIARASIQNGVYGNVLIEDTDGGARWCLGGPVGNYREGTQSYDNSYSFKATGSFKPYGFSEDQIALMPSMPKCIVYYIWERVE